jgi:SWI/SNF-related matrix-associated actin-dependent regulator 1 of chromatin subfamily A
MPLSPITVVKKGDRWIARFAFSYETKDIVKNAGFRFDGQAKVWYTLDASIAARLDPKTAAAAVAAVNRSIAQSRAEDADIAVPVPQGLAYLGYQKAGIAYAMSRANVLIADEMGLGKTIEAIGVVNADPTIATILIVCPATLRTNWQRELTKWLVRPMSIAIATGDNLPDTAIVIASWETITKIRRLIDARRWDLLVADEAHYAKNQKAQRTRALLGTDRATNADREKGFDKPIAARRRIFMTGTPVVNRPNELWPLVRSLDPHDLGASFTKFMFRYTNATNSGYGWDFNGAANLEELQTRMRAKFMVRRKKADVLTELPAKRRMIINLSANGAASVVRAENEAHTRHEVALRDARHMLAAAKMRGDKAEYEAAVRKLRQAQGVAFEEMSRCRHDTAVAKIPHLIEHLRDCLETGDKVVCFVHHHDVVKALREAFPGAAVVTGETAMAKRQGEVDRFQNDPNCLLFIGSITAAGVGITLTAASHVVFGELDWTPGNVSQAEDRCHRIGQRDSVLVQHLVFDSSVDARMATLIVEKQAVIDATLDNPTQQVALSEDEQALLDAAGRPAATDDRSLRDDAEIPF